MASASPTMTPLTTGEWLELQPTNSQWMQPDQITFDSIDVEEKKEPFNPPIPSVNGMEAVQPKPKVGQHDSSYKMPITIDSPRKFDNVAGRVTSVVDGMGIFISFGYHRDGLMRQRHLRADENIADFRPGDWVLPWMIYLNRDGLIRQRHLRADESIADFHPGDWPWIVICTLPRPTHLQIPCWVCFADDHTEYNKDKVASWVCFADDHGEYNKGKVGLSRLLRIPQDTIVGNVYSAQIVAFQENGARVDYGAREKGFVSNKSLGWDEFKNPCYVEAEELVAGDWIKVEVVKVRQVRVANGAGPLRWRVTLRRAAEFERRYASGDLDFAFGKRENTGNGEVSFAVRRANATNGEVDLTYKKAIAADNTAVVHESEAIILRDHANAVNRQAPYPSAHGPVDINMHTPMKAPLGDRVHMPTWQPFHANVDKYTSAQDHLVPGIIALARSPRRIDRHTSPPPTPLDLQPLSPAHSSITSVEWRHAHHGQYGVESLPSAQSRIGPFGVGGHMPNQGRIGVGGHVSAQPHTSARAHSPYTNQLGGGTHMPTKLPASLGQRVLPQHRFGEERHTAYQHRFNVKVPMSPTYPVGFQGVSPVRDRYGAKEYSSYQAQSGHAFPYPQQNPSSLDFQASAAHGLYGAGGHASDRGPLRSSKEVSPRGDMGFNGRHGARPTHQPLYTPPDCYDFPSSSESYGNADFQEPWQPPTGFKYQALPRGVDNAYGRTSAQVPIAVKRHASAPQAPSGVARHMPTPQAPIGVDRQVSAPEAPRGAHGQQSAHAPIGVDRQLSAPQVPIGVARQTSTQEPYGAHSRM